VLIRRGRLALGVSALLLTLLTCENKRAADPCPGLAAYLCGGVCVVLAGAKPIAVVAVPYTDELSGEVGDDRSLPRLYKAPAGGRGHAGHPAPVRPAVDVIETEVLGFGHLQSPRVRCR
jgi:hypothetical protein